MKLIPSTGKRLPKLIARLRSTATHLREDVPELGKVVGGRGGAHVPLERRGAVEAKHNDREDSGELQGLVGDEEDEVRGADGERDLEGRGHAPLAQHGHQFLHGSYGMK